YNGLGNRRISAGNKVSPATVCATVVPFYRVTVKHLSTSRRNAASEQLFSLRTTKKWDTVKPHADREFARELWNLSETLTGIYFQTEDFALFCCAL
ncbi:MAG TPA: hypothetical protein VJ723_03995, partial [Candidatus Angelobacter sp.]|nr:hypothetical protein [Candidatus Angelobacter sp.]